MACGCKNKQNVSNSVVKSSAPVNEARPQKNTSSRIIKREIR